MIPATIRKCVRNDLGNIVVLVEIRHFDIDNLRSSKRMKI